MIGSLKLVKYILENNLVNITDDVWSSLATGTATGGNVAIIKYLIDSKILNLNALVIHAVNVNGLEESIRAIK